ncbi:hypothetical protein [Bacillus subtilis]|uniref:hypothetical protein n=1 Tax=Bacillus subtilis TaxID=1423 RepID=UPI0011A6B535|nr:hypothetical protein [Bacillus subtilis]
MVNDEGGLKKVEDKVMDGKMSDMGKELNELSKLIKENMKWIGKSIWNKLIDKVKEGGSGLNSVRSGNRRGKKV